MSTTTHALIDDRQAARLAGSVQNDHPEVDERLAHQIVQQAVAYMHVAAETPGLSPSPLVDLGWHAFILDTMPYFDYCAQRFGRYLHHRPFTQAEVAAGAGRPLSDTVAAMRAAGFEVIDELWPEGYGDGACDGNGTGCIADV